LPGSNSNKPLRIMQSLTIYRILTFILVPVAVLFGFMDLFLVLTALSNPALLLFAFLFACLVIYIFSSLRFLSLGIDTGRPCKHSLRDWIRVNAFVSAIIGSIFMLNALTVFFSSDITLRQVLSTLGERQPNTPSMNTEMLLRMMKIFAYFIFFISVILFIHLRMTFRLLKQYNHLFTEPVQ
jgi:hypothetical protein